jgi:REP element-mobilizing transposase RayT
MELRRLIAVTNRHGLVHWQADQGTYFVTFSLFDALPVQIARQGRRQVEELLDLGRGAAYMVDRAVATIVFDALKFFHGDRYFLHALCVMPNHVHVVFRTAPRGSLDKILHSWKSYTAKEANRILGRTGTFWEREWRDSLISDEKELAAACAYVLGNPAKAGLLEWKWVERFDTPFKVTYEDGGRLEAGGTRRE